MDTQASVQQNAIGQGIVQALGNLVKAIAASNLPVGGVTSSAGSSAGYIPVTVGGTQYLVQVFNLPSS